MPKEDTQLEGHKFPFNACEILCSDNGLNLNKLLDTKEEKPEDEEEEKKEGEEEKKEGEEEKKEGEEEKKEEEKKEGEEEKKEEDKDEDKEEKEEKKGGFPSLSSNDLEDENSEKNDDKDENKEDEEETYNYPLMNRVLDHLFSFLDSKPSDDNYVLMGYFGKIVNFLFGENKTDTIMKYLLETRKDIVKKMIPHVDRKAIGLIIETIIQSIFEIEPTYFCVKDFDINKSVFEIVEILIDALLNKETTNEGIEIICETLTNAIITSSKDKFLLFLNSENISKKFQEAVATLTKDEDPRRGIYIIKMLNKINDVVIKDVDKKITPSFAFDEAENEILSIIRTISKRGQQSDYQKPWSVGGENIFSQRFNKYSEFLEPIVGDVIDDIMKTPIENDNQFENSCFQKQIKINMKTLYEWEFIRSVLDIIINEANEENGAECIEQLTKKLAEKNIFCKMVEMYQFYDNCNMFQNVFNQIISVLVNKLTPTLLIDNLLINKEHPEKELITLLMKSILEKNEFTYKSNKKMNSMNFSNDIDALKFIATSENVRIQEIIKETPLVRFYDLVVKQMSETFNKKLLYKEKVCENIYGKEEKDEDIPFSVVNIRDIFNFRIKIHTMAEKGENYQAEEKKEEERINSLLTPAELPEQNEEKDEMFNKDEFEDENINEENNVRCSGRDDVNLGEEPEQAETTQDESSYSDLNYWNSDPENLGVNDDILADLE